MGCATGDGCTTCTMNTSAKADSPGDPDIDIVSGGYLDFNSTAVTYMQPSDVLPAVLGEMIHVPAVVNSIQQFLQNTYGSDPVPQATLNNNEATLPAGYKFAWVNIHGRAGILPVPTAEFQINGATGGTSVTCSCSDGVCSLNGQEVAGGLWTLWYCQGTCTGTCSMSTGILDANGNPIVTKASTHYNY